jgi:hypothetical protein
VRLKQAPFVVTSKNAILRKRLAAFGAFSAVLSRPSIRFPFLAAAAAATKGAAKMEEQHAVAHNIL